MSELGQRVRIIDDFEKLKHNSTADALRQTGNNPSSGLSVYAGMTGKIVGFSSGSDYGDGMYDSSLYIIHLNMPDGSVKAVRVKTEYVEML